MTKEEILQDFKDLNFMYNDSSKLDELKTDLDKLEESFFISIVKSITDVVDSSTFESIVAEATRYNSDYSYIEIY